MKNSFGSNLSLLRKRAGLSQEALAEQLNVSRQAISNWERNLNEPDIDTIHRISELLHVSASDLLEGPSGSGTTEPPKIKPVLTIISIVLAVIHLALGICGFVNIAAVIFFPVMCAFVQSIIYIAFTMMMKSGNYDMLAGFDPKRDSIHATQLQMYWSAVLSGLTTILFELIFVLIYYIQLEKQMDYTTMMIFAYYAVEIICFVTISLKIKSRK